MFEQIGTYLSVIIAIMLGYIIVKMYNLERSFPDIIQDALNGVGEQISTIFAKPVVKASMSQLGMKSGEVRATKALKNRVAEKVMGQNVLISKACEYLGISAMEGMQLMNDPTMGPMIQGLVQKFGSSAQGFLGGNNGGEKSSSNVGYGVEK